MANFTFITANDIHITDNNPRSRIDDFCESVLKKIDQMRVTCEELNADAMLIAGDLFHFKAPMKNSHKMVRELTHVFKMFPCPIYMIEGNHDISENRIESLEKQPLGVLYESGVLLPLRNKYIEKEGEKVSLVGIPYGEDFEPSSFSIPDKNGAISQICLLHIYSSPTPGMLFKTRIYGYDELPVGPDFYVIGHYHIDQGIEERNGRYFINLGSISRGVLSEDTIDHHPKIGVIQISNGKKSARSIELKVKPVETIFNLRKREEEHKEQKKMEEFIEALVSESEIETSGKSIDEVIKNTKVSQNIKEKVLYFIQEAATVKKVA